MDWDSRRKVNDLLGAAEGAKSMDDCLSLIDRACDILERGKHNSIQISRKKKMTDAIEVDSYKCAVTLKRRHNLEAC